jgi:4-alpha-glucanotransferase
VFPRSSGILLHPTSLPGRFGIGSLGAGAFRFLDFLAAAGQRVWQVLPLGPTGYGDSPYQLFSAFAGNPLLISLEGLRDEGLLDDADLDSSPPFPEDRVDYGAVIRFKMPLLRRAHRNFRERAGAESLRALEEFRACHSAWLEDYALFMALKDAHGGEAVWTRWHPELRAREPAALRHWSERLRPQVEEYLFFQHLFYSQWERLRRRCRELGVRIMGDLPIYVAHDSADVWAHQHFFDLDERGEPARLAGVPPDYFSATGQLWGNPIYRWDAVAAGGYAWWVERFRAALEQFDCIRVDHFRGFEAYWDVPAGAPDARGGRWVKGPGAELFRAVSAQLGPLPLVAENLGVITPEVEVLRSEFGFPGMAILQFAFGSDPQAPDFKPHNFPRNRVAYTGTHDNDTAMGWWRSTGVHDSIRTAEEAAGEKAYAVEYLDAAGREINWAMIRALMASVADTVLFPLQDVLGLGSEARMNMPATESGNWRWRLRPGMLDAGVTDRLRRLAELYDRV